MATKWLKIFKVGTPHPNFEFTEQVVREIAGTYDYNRFPAPHSPGHLPPPGTPAFAWVPPDGLRFRDGFLELLFDPAYLSRAGFAALQSGSFRTISPAFYAPQNPYNPTPGKWHLRHNAWLGAENPAGKELDFLDKSLLEGFTPPAEWKQGQAFAFSETELANRDFVIFADTPPALSTLDIAEAGTGWDADGAKKRIMDKYGYAGLRAYCLYKDPKADPETAGAYSFPVADIISGTPKIIPKAVSAGLAFLSGARGANVSSEVAEKVKPKLERLSEKIKKTQDTAASEEDSDGGNTVDKNKLVALLLERGKGKVEDSLLASFAEETATSILAMPGFTGYGEQMAASFVENILAAKLETFAERHKREEIETKNKKDALDFAEKNRAAAITAAVDKGVSEGRIPSQKKADFVIFAQAMKNAEGADLTVEFSENNRQVAKPLYEFFFSQILPALVKEKHFTPPSSNLDNDGSDPAFAEQDKAADRIAASVNTVKEQA